MATFEQRTGMGFGWSRRRPLASPLDQLSAPAGPGPRMARMEPTGLPGNPDMARRILPLRRAIGRRLRVEGNGPELGEPAAGRGAELVLPVGLDHLLGMFAGGFGQLGPAEHAGNFLGPFFSGNAADRSAGASSGGFFLDHIVVVGKGCDLR